MSAGRSLALGVAVLAVGAGVAAAHDVRPGYLELRETTRERFALFWKVAARGTDEPPAVRPVFPAACRLGPETVGTRVLDAWVQRGSVVCDGGLDGARLGVEGLDAAGADVLVRILRVDGGTQVARLSAASPTLVVRAAPRGAGVARTYLWLGVEHILLGPDHLLFVLALLLLVRGTRRLVATVTAFTVAHSVTLAAATLDLVHVPAAPVEAVIALSVVFVAGEIVHGQDGRPGLTARRPWIVALVFGLLHGLGFAGALAEVGLPADAIPLALLFFNVGVEVGQLAFIAAVVVVRTALRPLGPAWPPRATRVPAYAIGGVAAYWTIERLTRL